MVDRQRAARLPGGNPPRHRGSLTAAAVIALLVPAPVISQVAEAFSSDSSLWPHLLAHVLPPTLIDAALLLGGVGVLVVAIGTGSAWLVTAYDFRGRALLDWALLLPLAMPTYIVAYAYMDLLHPIGPVQTSLRG